MSLVHIHERGLSPKLLFPQGCYPELPSSTRVIHPLSPGWEVMLLHQKHVTCLPLWPSPINVLQLLWNVSICTLHAIGEGHCGRPDANLCQAVEKYALALTCSLCDDQDKVQWSFSQSAGTVFTVLSQQTKTLLLAAVNVTNKKTSGCYMCQCGGEDKSMYFAVQVELPGE